MLIYLAIKVKDWVLQYTANIQLQCYTHIYSIHLNDESRLSFRDKAAQCLSS